MRRACGAHGGCRVRAGPGGGAGTAPALEDVPADAADSKQARLWWGAALDAPGVSKHGGHAVPRPRRTGTAGIRSRPAGWKMAGRGGKGGGKGARIGFAAYDVREHLGDAGQPGPGPDGPPMPCRGRMRRCVAGRAEGARAEAGRRGFAPHS